MSATLAQLRDYVKDELGADVVTVLGGAAFDADCNRYLNDGLRRLGYELEKTAPLVWDADDVSVALPTDFINESRLSADTGVVLPRERRVWNKVMYFEAQGAGSAGSATLFYFADHPVLALDGDATTLPGSGDVALTAFSCYRAYKRLSSSRALFQRYSTLVQANGVDVDELASIGDQYYAEFLEAKEGLPLRAPTTFYAD